MLNNAAEKRSCDEDEDEENQSGNTNSSDGSERQVRSLIVAI